MKPKRIKKDKSDFVALIDLRRMISEIMMYHMARYSRITKTDALEIAHDIIRRIEHKPGWIIAELLKYEEIQK